MLTLYALDQSRSLRIVWLLELLGVDYTLENFARDPQTHLAPPALKHIHALGKAPILADGQLVLPESGAIVEYLLHTYGQGRLQPAPDSAEYWQHQRWLHYAEGSLMPLMLLGLIFRKIDQAKMAFFVKPVARKISQQTQNRFIQPQVALHLQHINDSLRHRRWLLGDKLSGADIMLSFPLQAAATRFDAVADYTEIGRYLAQIRADDAWQRAEAKTGSLKLDSL